MSFHDEQRALVTCLKRLWGASTAEVLRDQEFRNYSGMRNRFNDYQVTKLTEQAPYSVHAPIYKDNLGRKWEEVTVGIKYHVPAGDWAENAIRFGKSKKERFSRKFLCEALLPGYEGATYEMIVSKSGTRIVSGELMETFNFGEANARSSVSGKVFGQQVMAPGVHFKFDMAPHDEYGYGHYKSFPANYPVKIIDFADLVEMGAVSRWDVSL